MTITIKVINITDIHLKIISISHFLTIMGGKTHLIKANNRFNEHNKYQKLNVNKPYVNQNIDNLNTYNITKHKNIRYNEYSKINNKTYNYNENQTINNIINPLKKKIKGFALELLNNDTGAHYSTIIQEKKFKLIQIEDKNNTTGKLYRQSY